MEIIVLSRSRFDEIILANGINDSNVNSIKDSFFISILNNYAIPGANFHQPIFKKNHSNVLTLSFDDISSDNSKATYLTNDLDNPVIYREGVPITENQAGKIVKFILKNLKKEVAFIHCAAGISRSGAIGAFISDLVGNKYSHFKAINPYVHENIMVTRLLKQKYNEIENKKQNDRIS